MPANGDVTFPFKCHLLSEAFSHWTVSNYKMPLSLSLFYVFHRSYHHLTYHVLSFIICLLYPPPSQNVNSMRTKICVCECVSVFGINSTHLIPDSPGHQKPNMVLPHLKSCVPSGDPRGESVSCFLDVTCIRWLVIPLPPSSELAMASLVLLTPPLSDLLFCLLLLPWPLWFRGALGVCFVPFCITTI